MKNKTPTSNRTDTKNKSQDSISTKLDNIENLINVMDEKNERLETRLSFKIGAEVAQTEDSLEKTLQAQIRVSAKELEEKVRVIVQESEDRLNKRIKHVSDLTVMNFHKPISDHEKRIKKLEKAVAA